MTMMIIDERKVAEEASRKSVGKCICAAGNKAPHARAHARWHVSSHECSLSFVRGTVV